MVERNRCQESGLMLDPCACTASAPAAQPAMAQRSKLALCRKAYKKPDVNMSPAGNEPIYKALKVIGCGYAVLLCCQIIIA